MKYQLLRIKSFWLIVSQDFHVGPLSVHLFMRSLLLEVLAMAWLSLFEEYINDKLISTLTRNPLDAVSTICLRLVTPQLGEWLVLQPNKNTKWFRPIYGASYSANRRFFRLKACF